MILRWLRRRRRDALLSQPFPSAWEATLEAEVGHYEYLDRDERARLRDFVRVFVAEKSWEGCGGLELDDEIRVIISALAGLLVLGREHQFFRNVKSILVYPSTIKTPDRSIGSFQVPMEPVASGVPILGEAQLHGPVILVWDAVLKNARNPETGHNVVYHEFAHKLDMLDGAADGTPPLGSRDAMKRWVNVCGQQFLRLRERVAKGQPTFLDAYGATNEAEFFAVATEYFFDKPRQMERKEAELYDLLRDFYGQDPAARERAAASSHPT
jgi:Mlc titration factor MtfA (ptsG expression regulator)